MALQLRLHQGQWQTHCATASQSQLIAHFVLHDEVHFQELLNGICVPFINS